MLIDQTWTILFFAGALLALRMSWSTPVRAIGVGLLFSVCFTTLFVSMLPDFLLILEPAIMALAELFVCASAVMCLRRAPTQAGAIMALNLLSCIVSMSYLITQKGGLVQYEEKVNAILAVQCMIQWGTGLWAHVGNRLGCHLRMRRHRRHAMHALLRFRVASGRSQQSD